MFVKILNPGHKYSLLNRENFKKAILIQLSQKRKLFSQFVSAFFKYRLNFEHFQNKVNLIADVFPMLQTPKNVGKQMSKKSRFRGLFKKQHGKVDQTMLKSERHLPCHIY